MPKVLPDSERYSRKNKYHRKILRKCLYSPSSQVCRRHVFHTDIEKLKIRRGKKVREYTPSNRGMTKDDLIVNKSGRVVSRNKSLVATKKYMQKNNKFRFAIENCFPERDFIENNNIPSTPVSTTTSKIPNTPPVKNKATLPDSPKNNSNSPKPNPKKQTPTRKKKPIVTFQSPEPVTTLAAWLKDNEKVVVQVPQDGNCLFHAVAGALKLKSVGLSDAQRERYKASEIRKAAVEYLEKSPDAKEHFENFFATETFDAYCKRMKKSGEYGDQITLIAIACAFDLIIKVVVNSNPIEIYENYCYNQSSNNYIIELKLTQMQDDHIDGSGHYDYIIDKSLSTYKNARENALANNLLEFPFDNKVYTRSSNDKTTFSLKKPAKPS